MTPLNGKVLALGEDTRSFLAVIRSFGRAGLEVHTAWCPRDSPALASRYIRRDHVLAPYRTDDLAWLDSFCGLLERERFDFVLPSTDAEILALQWHRERVERSGRVHLLPADAYWTCANKAKTHALARELGIPVPRQVKVESLDGLRRAATDFGFPVFLKPETSSRAPNPFARQNVMWARNPAQLEAHGAGMLLYGPALVQQTVPGIGVGLEFLSHDGEILTAFQHERVHEVPGGGRSGYRRSVPIDARMYHAVEQLAKALHYTGLGMVEFKHDPGTGKWALLEINARVWGSLPLAIAAGVDFPRYLYELAVLGRKDFPKTYRAHLYCRHWTADLDWLHTNAAARREDRAPEIRSRAALAAEAFNIVALRERNDTFQFADPRPAFLDLQQYIRGRAFSVLQRRRSFRANQGSRAAMAFARAQRVLFVCYGNICRSPFAAEMLRKLRPDLQVYSSGCHPEAKRPSPQVANEAAQSFGIDLSSHRSAFADAASIKQADLIFIFDRRNQADLAQRFAGFESKLYFLGSLDPDGPLQIADPYGLPLKGFQSCYARIGRILEKLAGSDRAPA